MTASCGRLLTQMTARPSGERRVSNTTSSGTLRLYFFPDRNIGRPEGEESPFAAVTGGFVMAVLTALLLGYMIESRFYVHSLKIIHLCN